MPESNRFYIDVSYPGSSGLILELLPSDLELIQVAPFGGQF